MATLIWKYELGPGWTVLDMPKGAEILTVQVQEETAKPVLWAEVDPGEPIEKRTVAAYWTGEVIRLPRKHRRYVGTFQLKGLVFHVFERVND